jgi:hypothetical protein
LQQLHADQREAKAELHEVLERLAERHDINYAIRRLRRRQDSVLCSR